MPKITTSGGIPANNPLCPLLVTAAVLKRELPVSVPGALVAGEVKMPSQSCAHSEPTQAGHHTVVEKVGLATVN
jgi:hypothetical protein